MDAFSQPVTAMRLWFNKETVPSIRPHTQRVLYITLFSALRGFRKMRTPNAAEAIAASRRARGSSV